MNRPLINLSNKLLWEKFRKNPKNLAIVAEVANEIRFRSLMSEDQKAQVFSTLVKLASQIRKPPNPLLTIKEAKRGIYMDFEGLRKEPPSLVGILTEEDFQQVVVDEGLQSAAEAKELEFSKLEMKVKSLLKQAREEKRKIIGFTRIELRLVDKYTNLGPDLKKFYLNAHKIAKKWVERFHQNENLKSLSLKNLADFTGSPYPVYLGKQQAAARIRYVRDMLNKWNVYKDITPVAKGKWTKLLQYNTLDCYHMRDLMLIAAGAFQKIE